MSLPSLRHAAPLSLPAPTYEDHFEGGGLSKLARHGMYEIRQTYELLRDLMGYRAHYVNFGYWPDGIDTAEPGRRLVLLLGDRLGLGPGQRLLDAGCGLGQGAVDLAQAHDLSRVVGVNPCGPQVAFARRLVASADLDDRVRIVQDCANAFVERLAPGRFDAAMAVECLSYFPDPRAFLSALRHRVLPRDGRVAFCVVTSERSQSRWERLFLGLVSNAPSHPGAWFERLLREAGFGDVTREDITADSLVPAIAHARGRIEQDPQSLRRHGWVTEQVVRRLIDQADHAVRSGWTRYELFTAAG